MLRSTKWTLLLTGLFFLTEGGTAFAGLLPFPVKVNTVGANYRYTYGVVLTSDTILNPGDYFTIYDFAGFIPGSDTAPSNFKFSFNGTGPTPGRLNPDDDPKIPNVTWTYTGAARYVGQSNLGNFEVMSIYGTTDDGFFTARTHRQVDGVQDSNITETTVPVPAPPGVPEPSTLLLFALGIPLAAAARYRNRNKATI